MYELVIISGKGGTGKTSVVSSFAALAGEVVVADADVDAPNLSLVLSAEPIEMESFSAGLTAVRDPEGCLECGICREHCRFDAIDEKFSIHPMACEGCGLCAHLCPEGAIRMAARPTGRVLTQRTPYGSLVSARLPAGEDNSGKLVARVKERARELAARDAVPLVIVDGPPGIGCPAISAVSGANSVLLVAEPGVAGIHDLLRTLDLTEHFEVTASVMINKSDISPDITRRFRRVCQERGIHVIGCVPFDRKVVDAIVAGRPPATHSDGPAARALRGIWEQVRERLPRGAATGV